jgi:hypothetical protein
MTVAVTSEPSFLNDGTRMRGLVRQRSSRFGASMEKSTVILHLIMVRVFKEAEDIS